MPIDIIIIIFNFLDFKSQLMMLLLNKKFYNYHYKSLWRYLGIYQCNQTNILCKYIPNMINLSSITINNNHIDLDMIILLIKQCKHLTKIDLSCNIINIKQIKTYSNLKSNQLQSINLSRIRYTGYNDSNIDLLPLLALSIINKLTYLNLDWYQSNIKNQNMLQQILDNNQHTLLYLNLRKYFLNTIKIIKLNHLSNLIYLNLDYCNNININEIKQLKKLQYLYLVYSLTDPNIINNAMITELYHCLNKNF